MGGVRELTTEQSLAMNERRKEIQALRALEGDLTPREHRLVDIFTSDLGITKKDALKQAGWGAKVPNYAIFRRPRIEEAIKRREKDRFDHSRVESDRVLAEEMCIAYSDLALLFDKDGTRLSPHELPEEIRRAIAELKIIEFTDKDGNTETTYKYKFWNKGNANERISKHLGLYERDNRQKLVQINIGKLSEDRSMVNCNVKSEGNGEKPAPLKEITA